jgi:environmental stress-induced protein Ves
VIRAVDLVETPWKNGGGVTSEVTAQPPGAGFDTFDWRISVADVAQSGPFSSFEGINRTLVLLAGAGMRLNVAPRASLKRHDSEGVSHTLRKPTDMVHFFGESDINATLVNGTTRDFNVMVRRTSARSDLTVWSESEFDAALADTLVFFCTRGPVDLVLNTGESYSLGVHDTVRIDAPGNVSCTLRGTDASLLAIRLYELQAPIGTLQT